MPQMVGLPGTDLETDKVKEIKPVMDSEIIKKLWNVVWGMWEQWNKAQHNSNINHKLILEKDANNKTREIYEVGPDQLARADLSLMRNSVEQQLQLLFYTK